MDSTENQEPLTLKEDSQQTGPTKGVQRSRPIITRASKASKRRQGKLGLPRWTFGGCLVIFVLLAIYSMIVIIFPLGLGVYHGLQERALLNLQEAQLHYERGVVDIEGQQYELAIAEFEHTLRLDPTHRQARDALRDAKTTLLAQPTPTSGAVNEAITAILVEVDGLAQEERWQEVVDRLTQVRSLGSDFQAQQISDLFYIANYQLGLELVSIGQVEEGLDAFQQALAERPDDPDVTYQLDLASLFRSAQFSWGSDWAGTIDYLEQLYTLRPDYLNAEYLLYQAYESYGDQFANNLDWCQAEAQYMQAALLRPEAAIQSKQQEAANLCAEAGSEGSVALPTPVVTPEATMLASSPVSDTTPIASTGSTVSAGGMILFSRFDAEKLEWTILSVSPGGGQANKILSQGNQPAVSPNGQLLAYHAEIDESEGIHVFDLSTGEDVRVTKFGEDVTPGWGPDNLKLIFPSQREGDRQWRLYVGWADGQSESDLLMDGRTPALSPDGTLLAYQGTDEQGNNPGIYLSGPGGGNPTRLTDHESDRAPAWTPTCRTGGTCQIAFMSSRDGSWQIYVVDVEGGSVQKLTQAAGSSGLPTWSPDGSRLAFVSDRDGSWGVYVMPSSGGPAGKIADWGGQRDNWQVERISWGP